MQLPPELEELVARVEERTRLWKSERHAVRVELRAHFRDGLASGRTAEELVRAFGDADTAARLIRDAKRKCRPPSWKLCVLLTRSVAVAALWCVMIYGVSAYRLYGSNAPHPLPGPRTIGDVARRYLVLDSPDVSAARTRVLWGRDAGTVANLRREAAVRLADARMGSQLHQPGRAAAGIHAAFAIARRLQDASAPPHELAAMWIYDRAATLVDELVRTNPLCAGAVRDEVVRLAERAELNRIHVRTSVIRSGFDDLIANVYTRDDEAGDGRLTGRGLRLIQALNGKTRPGILDVLFEPALFALPVRRSQVETEIARLLTAAGGGVSGEYLTNAPVLRREVARRTQSRRELFAYYPAVVFMPRVVDAITQAERARALLAWVGGSRLGPSPPVALARHAH